MFVIVCWFSSICVTSFSWKISNEIFLNTANLFGVLINGGPGWDSLHSGWSARQLWQSYWPLSPKKRCSSWTHRSVGTFAFISLSSNSTTFPRLNVFVDSRVRSRELLEQQIQSRNRCLVNDPNRKEVKAKQLHLDFSCNREASLPDSIQGYTC